MLNRSRGMVWGLAAGLLALAGVASADACGVSRGIEPLQVTVTDGGYSIRPQVEPGRYEIVVENLSGQDVALELVRAPYGWTDEQLQLAGEVTTEVVPVGEADAHGRGYLIVDLEAGQWLVRSAGQEGSYAAALAVGSAG